MSDISIFVDESGTRDGNSAYYLLTLVLHDQEQDIYERIQQLRMHLQTEVYQTFPFMPDLYSMDMTTMLIIR